MPEGHVLRKDIMSTSIEKNAKIVLDTLANQPRDQYVKAKELAEITGLSPPELNDAIALLVESGEGHLILAKGNQKRDSLTAS